jgi:cytochrome b subunit of formate dehydrogenase
MSDLRYPGAGRVWMGGVLVAALLLGGGGAALADDPDNCLLCHQYRGLGRYLPDADAVHLYFVSPDYQYRRLGAHARIACTDCHPRDEVAVIPHAPTAKVNCTQQCHLRDVSGLDRRFSHAEVARVLERSVHDADTLAGLEFTGGPLLEAGQSQCLYCHDEPLFRDPAGVIPQYRSLGQHAFDRCDGCHEYEVPVDTQYYLRHVTARLRTARPPLELAQACSVCHSDPKVLAQFDMREAATGYTGTLHGKAALLGSENTADCINCHARRDHDSHLVLSQENPDSITNVAHRADSCRQGGCHPGADPAIAQAAVHLDLPSLHGLELWLAIGFVFFTLLTFGPSLVITTLELFQIVVGRHVEDEAPMHRLTVNVLRHPEGRARLRRFTPGQRWQHWILVIVFATLVATGFPMKFASQEWARYVVEAMGGLGNARFIHHWAGVFLIIGFVTHLLVAILRMLIGALRRQPDGTRPGLVQGVMSMPMFVGPRDLLKANQLMAYLLFLRKKPPRFGRFSIDQKFEYLGVFWGTMLLGATGLILWFPEISSRYIDGRVFNLALIAHTYEAFLAVIHVGILHICNVMFAPQVFPFSPATLTGNTPVERLSEVHGDQVIEVARELGVAVPPEVQP